MTHDDDFIAQLEDYLEVFDGSTPLPDRVRHAIRAELPSARQVRPRTGLLRIFTMFSNLSAGARLGVAAATVVVAVVLGAAFLNRNGTNVGVGGATPSPIPTIAASPSAASLTGRPWGLSTVTGKTPDFEAVVPAFQQPDYSITFNTDGTYSGTAVCNHIAGTYTTSGQSLTLTGGALMFAFCPSVLHGDGDIATIFAHSLTKAATYTVSDTLTITQSDGGKLTFNALGAVPSTAGSSAVASLSPAPTAPPELLGKTWKLKSIADRKLGFQGVVPEADRSKYTINFAADGTFNATADCNRLDGTYTAPRMAGTDLPAGGMTMLPGPAAIADCPPGSLADLFVTGLGSTSSYVIDGNQLTIALGDASPLQFTP